VRTGLFCRLPHDTNSCRRRKDNLSNLIYIHHSFGSTKPSSVRVRDTAVRSERVSAYVVITISQYEKYGYGGTKGRGKYAFYGLRVRSNLSVTDAQRDDGRSNGKNRGF
jgi:hypothetical protein